MSANIPFTGAQGTPSLEELKLQYYRLYIQYYQQEHNYLEICRCYRAIYDTPSILADPAQWQPVRSPAVTELHGCAHATARMRTAPASCRHWRGSVRAGAEADLLVRGAGALRQRADHAAEHHSPGGPSARLHWLSCCLHSAPAVWYVRPGLLLTAPTPAKQDKRLEELPLYHELLQSFITKEVGPQHARGIAVVGQLSAVACTYFSTQRLPRNLL